MYGEKLTDAQKQAMREFKKTHTRPETMARFGVSASTVNRVCKGVESTAKVEVNRNFNSSFAHDQRKIKPEVLGICTKLKFSELSPEDQEKYNNCKPAHKEVTRTYAGW